MGATDGALKRRRPRGVEATQAVDAVLLEDPPPNDRFRLRRNSGTPGDAQPPKRPRGAPGAMPPSADPTGADERLARELDAEVGRRRSNRLSARGEKQSMSRRCCFNGYVIIEGIQNVSGTSSPQLTQELAIVVT